MGSRGSIGGEPDCRVVEDVKFIEGIFAGRSVYDVTIIEHGENRHLDQSEFGRWGESGAQSI